MDVGNSFNCDCIVVHKESERLLIDYSTLSQKAAWLLHTTLVYNDKVYGGLFLSKFNSAFSVYFMSINS